MYHCSKCGRDIEAPKDITVRSARCQCGNMVSFSDAVTMVPQSALHPQAPIGEIIIPGYRIVKKIGEGGMGSVFEAVQESLERKVAIKVLPGNLANDPQFVKRFDREAGTLSQLRHPNIVGIIDKGSVNGTYYFVMEYIADKDGNNVTLYDLISQHKIDKDRVLKFIREIAGALAYAHSKGIIHRDIKPSNILIDELSTARVVDFGIAQILGDEQNKRLHLTMTGEAIGTPQYMSPEQKTNASKSDARSDIYSLGVMVYEMLTGGFPEGAWDLPSELGCDPKWDSIVESSIRKLPERRFQTMTEFLSSLDTVEKETSVPKETSTASVDKPKEERYRTPVPSTSILGKCPSCGEENPGDNRFCNGCGASLYESCPACQGEIRVGLKFCGKCGIDIPKQKKINELKEAISKALAAASAKKDDIVAATEILLEAVKTESSLVEISGTSSGNAKPQAVHEALNNLWDEKALASEIFLSSGIKHIEFLNRIFKELPDRKDIQANIGGLYSERDKLLEELRNLFKNGHFLSLMQTASKSRWCEYPEIASVVADAKERFDKANKLVDSQIPRLIEGKRYHELNIVITELEKLNMSIEGLSELRKETVSTLSQAKQLYELAVVLNSNNKLQEAAKTLEKLKEVCSDYPDTSALQANVTLQISKCLKNLKAAKSCIACKEYNEAIDLLKPLLLKYDSDELKTLYAETIKGKKRTFKRNMLIAGFALLVAISIIIAFIVNRHLTYNSYYEKANLALSVKDYEKAIELYNKALDVPGHNNETSARNFLQEAELALERKAKFEKLMIKGKQYLEIKEWASAEKAFNDAVKVTGYENDREAQDNLKKCEEYLSEYRNKNDKIFKSAVLEGTNALSAKDYEKALKSFEGALKIPGYENNENAIKQRDQAKIEKIKTKWDDTKPKVNSSLSEAKNTSLNIAIRIDSADSAMALLQKISESSDIIYLPDSEKSDIASLKSEISSLKSKLIRIPDGFVIVKYPTLETNGWASEIRHKTTGIEMVYVAPGEFMMGSSIQEQDEAVKQGAPRECVKGEVKHRVKLTKGYYIGKYEITQDQWKKVIGDNPSHYKNSGGDVPVESVSWDDCKEFCRKIGGGFRLPTEAEWEFSARGGIKSKGFIYSGSNNLDGVGWYDSNSENKTHSVGRKDANELNLYDMSGNVWEWCSDRYVDYPSEGVLILTGPATGSFRVLRGGGGGSYAGHCRSAYRFRFLPADRRIDFGFRLAMSIPVSDGKQNSVTNISSSVSSNNAKSEILNQSQQSDSAPVAGKDWTIPEIGMEFIWIKALNCWVGKYEVTNGEYRKFKSDQDSKSYNGKSLNGDSQPVVNVNYNDATKYANWLTERERKNGRIPPGYSYRLPTEKEWTTFCQCGDNRKYPWGNEWPPKYGNYSGQESAWQYKIDSYNDGFPVTCAVEKSGKNDWGLYGVGGNVWECTIKSSSDLSFDAWRGASWRDLTIGSLMSTYRLIYDATDRFNYYGFRLVLSH